MKLREFFSSRKNLLVEGGNLASHTSTGEPTKGFTGMPGVHKADKIDAKNRAAMQPVVKQLLVDINNTFARQYGRVIWNSELLEKEVQEFISGSSKWFMYLRQPNPSFDPRKPVNDANPKEIGIDDTRFQRVKKKVGDIDTQIDRKLEPQIEEFLHKNVGKSIGSAVLAGFKKGTDQWLALWKLNDPPLTIQVDLEFVDYTTDVRGFEIPTEWAQVSHGSQLEDLDAGIKGVFRQWLYRSLAKIAPTSKYIAKLAGRGKARKMTVFGGDDGSEPVIDINNPPPPVNDANFSFSVASAGGGGVRAKYREPTSSDGIPSEINGVPVMVALSSTESNYINDLAQQFEQFFGQTPQEEERKLMYSLVGTVELMKKYFDDNQIETALQEFLKINFGPGAQMIAVDEPEEDFKTKMTAVDYLLDNLDKKNLRKQALSMAKEYGQQVSSKQGSVESKSLEEKFDVPTTEEDNQPTKPNYARQGIKHLYSRLPDGRVSSMEMNDRDFIDLVKEISDNGGTFDGVPVTLKVDGAGIRFGKDESGRPFFMTSNVTQPLYKDNVGYFTDYGRSKGQSEENLARTKKYDDALSLIVNSDFIQTLPPDTIVQAEMMYNDMAQDVGGQLKFVNIPYDPKKLGRQMTLVPFTAKQYSTGETRSDQDKILQKLISASSPEIKIVTNQLQQKGINVSKIIDPAVNMDPALVNALSARGKNPQKDQARQILDQVRQQLSSAIIDSPNLKGKDIIGQNMEGIVVSMPSGKQFKVTSQQMKSAMAAKNVPGQFGDTKTRTAVVAPGSFAGHIGHEALINFAIDKAKELNGTVFVYVEKKVGEQDPIDVPTKLETLNKLFPNVNISPVTNQSSVGGEETAGNIMKKIEYELVKKDPFYNNIVITVGQDREQSFKHWAKHAQKRFSEFPPLAHVKLSVDFLVRGSEQGGIDASTTLLRDALKNDSIEINKKIIPTKTEEQKFAVWSRFYNVQKLGANWIKHLMDVARKNMRITKPVAEPVQQPQPSLAEKMLPKSAFAGSDKNKLGPAAHLKGKMKRPARQGDLVGDAEESRTVKGVPVNEDIQAIMNVLIEKIIVNEAIQNKN